MIESIDDIRSRHFKWRQRRNNNTRVLLVEKDLQHGNDEYHVEGTEDYAQDGKYEEIDQLGNNVVCVCEYSEKDLHYYIKKLEVERLGGNIPPQSY